MFRPDESDPPPPDRDPLDALLAQAAWPEPRPGQIARLRAYWRRLHFARPSGRWLAAAAAILAAGFACWYALERRGDGDRPAAELDSGPLPVDVAVGVATAGDAANDEDVAESPPGELASSAAHEHSRPPNGYERLVLASAIRRQKSVAAPKRNGEQAALLADAIDALIANADADAEALAVTLLSDRVRHELTLLDILARPDDGRRMAALRLWPHLATWRSVPALRQLVSTGQSDGPTKRALARLGTPAEAAWLVEAEADRAVRIELLAALAERDDRQAVPRLLRFVSDIRWADDALSALEAVEEPPLDALFAALIGNDVRERRASARVLGRINGPEVTERLVGLALDGIYRQEAMLALVACRGTEAQAFVRHARQDLALVAAVQAAEYQFRQFPHSDPRRIP